MPDALARLDEWLVPVDEWHEPTDQWHDDDESFANDIDADADFIVRRFHSNAGLAASGPIPALLHVLKRRRAQQQWTASMVAFRVNARDWNCGYEPIRREPSVIIRFPAELIKDLASQAPTRKDRIFEAWPRMLQAFGLTVAFVALILAAADVLTPTRGIFFGFLGLSVMFFGDFAAVRRNGGDGHTPFIATWGALITAIAVAVGALTGG